MLTLYKHLLARAKAWSITIDKNLRKFFVGLVGLPEDIKTFIDEVWQDIFPTTTRELDLWEEQFGLPDSGLSDADRRTRLAAAWATLGDQDLTYIQDTLQARGFNVWVHEWWVPGSEPAVNVAGPATARDPVTTIVAPSYPLVNKIVTTSLEYIAMFDGGAAPTANQFGKSDSQFGRYDNIIFSQVQYTIPTDTTKWPYFIYIGGQTFPATASIPLARKDEFEDLCLKICPTQNWIGVLVTFP